MLPDYFHTIGFFPIQWASVAPTAVATAATTYVLPTPKGVLRVVVPAAGAAMELYSGSLLAGELRYRGPVLSEADLQLLVQQHRYGGLRAA